MKIQNLLLVGAAIPVTLAAGAIAAWWVTGVRAEDSLSAVLRATAWTAVVGLAALAMTVWLYQMARRLGGRFSHLLGLIQDAPAVTPGSGPKPDDLDRVSLALDGLKDMARRNAELAQVCDDLRSTSQRTEQTVKDMRQTEVSMADCLARLSRAERAVTNRSRSAVMGHLVAGLSCDFSDQLEAVLLAGDSPRAAARLPEIARDLQRRLKLYGRLISDRAHQVESFNLKELLDDTVLITEPRWRSESLANGVSFNLSVTCTAAHAVQVDRYDLLEMLVHLLDNAMLAMPLGGAIQIEAHASASKSVMLSISDQGAGMTDELRRVCCEPLFSTREDAAGMGLAVASALARRNKIRFGLTSARGQGTTALLEIPPGHSLPTAGARAETAITRPQLVLVVDDHPLTAEMVADLVQSEGHVADTCTEPMRAMEKLGVRRYDVLITDRAMPGMNGIELARSVKGVYPGMPVILLTGFAETMNSRGERPASVDLVVGKPCTRSDLLTAIAGVTRADRSSVPASRLEPPVVSAG